MISRIKIAGVFCASVMFISVAVAESHGDEESPPQASFDEQTLIAIKEALVAEAQALESQVVNIAYLDPQGQLHESTVVHSGMRVRGIQVKSYIDAMKAPKVELTLDEKTGQLPVCFVNDDHLKRTVRIQPLHLVSQFSPDTRRVVLSSADRLLSRFESTLETSRHWFVKRPLEDLDRYTTLMTGRINEPSQYQLRLTVANGRPPVKHKKERVVGSDPISVFFFGEPSAFHESWIQMKAELVESREQTVVWTGQSDFRVPVRNVTYGEEPLPDGLVVSLEETVNQWVSNLDEYSACQPVHFEASSTDGKITLDGGADSGLAVGDKLLLLNPDRIPSRVLEPGTLAELSLVSVVSVQNDLSIIDYLAGAPISEAPGKVALLF